MINLLPHDEKKNVAREYTLRRLNVVLVVALSLVVVAFVALMPVYILTFYKAQAEDMATVKNSSNSQEEASSTAKINTAKTLMQVLKPDTTTVMPSEIIMLLDQDRTSKNSITSISYIRGDDNTISVSVTGLAQDRESLSTFTDTLGHEPGISNVNVPVAVFAKDSNIPFTFTMSAAVKK